MFGFMLKKAFFDFWDNFFHFVILNLLMIVSATVPIILTPWIGGFSPVLAVIVLVLGLVWMGILISTASLYVNEIAQFRKPEVKQFFVFLKEGWKTGLIFALLWGIVGVMVFLIFPFYAGMKNMVGTFALAFLFWTVVVFVLAMQYFLPVRAQLDKKTGKVMKKMFIIMFDNVIFTILLLLASLIFFSLSAFTAFLVFGPAGVLLMGQVALKLRLYKYDYIEENPGQNRRKIPWSALIHEDRQRVGKRTFKGMIFPWKD